MISAAIGRTSPKMPSAATCANAHWALFSIVSASSPNSSAPAQGMSTAAHRFGGKHDRRV